ncbi:MFS transporter [Pantoea cypripedii]|uniref:MFS transporter n=1 Tax=Pantoea cypripedii TaxID=55209 RepID=A0A6B9G4H1_PANCY|nr:MFS transporter [Pantoea cypripedii]QGY32571.1 MFS transporter [Pantoea cypripedii]
MQAVSVKNPARAALSAALLGFFIITLDAVVVNVALPTIGRELNASIIDLQWIVDSYTLAFAALLLFSGSLCDLIGARMTFVSGLSIFVLASIACGMAKNTDTLIISRFVQGVGAALIMPATMSLIRHHFVDATQRGRAVAIWAMGGSVASTSGPLIGGILTQTDWRWIFLINIPVGLIALALLTRIPASPKRAASFDYLGQLAATLFMGSLIYGTIESGRHDSDTFSVWLPFILSLVSLIFFMIIQKRNEHPMIPEALIASSNVRISMLVGFTFMAGYFGLPFLMSLYLQQHLGLSAAKTGVVFLPMMLTGLIITPFTARLVHRFNARNLIVSGLTSMAAGMLLLTLLPTSVSVAWISLTMILVGIAGPLVAPPVAALLLNSVSPALAGIASGVFNTSRQVGGAMAIAIFGAILAQSPSFMPGLHASLILAACLSLGTAVIALKLHS